MLDSPDVQGVDKAEEHHGGVSEDVPPTAGTVVSSHAVHRRHAPSPDDERNLFPLLGSGVIVAVPSADGWTPDHGDLSFAGYVVRLTDVQDPR